MSMPTSTSTQRGVVVGVFDNRVDAEQGVDELKRLGFRDDQIGFAMRDAPRTEAEAPAAARAGELPASEEETEAGRDAAKGVVSGGVVGGVLGALATGLIPGVGPVVAAGLLAGIIGGAAVGAAAGGLIGSLVGLGLSEEEARYYQQQFESGRAVVTVNAGARAAEAQEALHRFGATDVQHPQGRPGAQTSAADVRSAPIEPPRTDYPTRAPAAPERAPDLTDPTYPRSTTAPEAPSAATDRDRLV
jgi:hypothetical protein